MKLIPSVLFAGQHLTEAVALLAVYGSQHGPATQQLADVEVLHVKCFFHTISDGCCCCPGLGKILLQQKMEIMECFMPKGNVE